MSNDIEIIRSASREEWLQKRQGLGFGASESACLFGVGRKSALALVLEKAGLQAPEAFTDEQQEEFEIALAMEAAAAELWSKRSEPYAFERNSENAIYRLPSAPFLFATPDAFAIGQDAERKLLQFKTDRRAPWDEVPLQYQIQVQQELFCTGLKHAEIPAIFYAERHRFRIYEIEADPEFQALLVARARAAWDVVERLRSGERVDLPEPGPEDGAALAKLVKARAVTTIHQFSEADEDAVARWEHLAAERKVYGGIAEALEKAEKHERHKLVLKMNGAEIGQLPDGRLLKAKARERAGYEVGPSAWVELREVRKEDES